MLDIARLLCINGRARMTYEGEDAGVTVLKETELPFA
jgi:hypothetical protein